MDTRRSRFPPLHPCQGGSRPCNPKTTTDVRRRIDEEGMSFLGVRLHGNAMFCRAARFETLRRELGDGFESIKLPGEPAKPALEPPRSVPTIGLADREAEPTRAAASRVVAFCRSGSSLDPRDHRCGPATGLGYARGHLTPRRRRPRRAGTYGACRLFGQESAAYCNTTLRIPVACRAMVNRPVVVRQ